TPRPSRIDPKGDNGHTALTAFYPHHISCLELFHGPLSRSVEDGRVVDMDCCGPRHRLRGRARCLWTARVLPRPPQGQHHPPPSEYYQDWLPAFWPAWAIPCPPNPPSRCPQGSCS